MSTYVIGDVQGCHASLMALLAILAFDRGKDRLLLVGDLVNRGPQSLAVLRFVHSLGDGANAVLGNHDLHLLARGYGLAAAKRRDTLDEVLAASDRAALFDWLLQRPLLLQVGGHVLVHAGLLPKWTIADAVVEARRWEALLRAPQTRAQALTAKEPEAGIRALTSLRMVDKHGQPAAFDGRPEAAPQGLVPWFKHPKRCSSGTPIVFGHWSALGAQVGDDYACLDSGCVWGRQLTAMRLEDGRLWSVQAVEAPLP